MANNEHVELLAQGVSKWNQWRKENPSIKPNLSEIKLSSLDLSAVNLSDADLEYSELKSVRLIGANLQGANLYGADLTPVPVPREVRKRGWDARGSDEVTIQPTDFTRANLKGTVFHEAKLGYVRFIDADLTDAQLWWSDLFAADLTRATLIRTELDESRLTYARFIRADLTDASLVEISLVKTSFEGATLSRCNVYGIAAWDVYLSRATQSDLIITPPSAEVSEPTLTVDSLEVAQFIYLLLKNEKLRDVIQTMTSKAVLILGNFAPERKEVLEAIKGRLRELDYLPILFDFEGPDSRDIVETVTTVARLARFVIADLTQPRSVPDELRAIVPDVAVPVLPLIEGSENPVATFDALSRSHRDRVLGLRRYGSFRDLLAGFGEDVVAPAEEKFRELYVARAQRPEEVLMQPDGDEDH